MKYKQFDDLPVWKTARELAGRVYRLIEAGRLDAYPALRDQIERASLSVSNNIAEGFDRGTHGELLNYLYIARGSAGEVRSMIFVMEGLTGLADDAGEVRAIRALALSSGRQLGAWLEALKNSDEQGPRHRNDETRRRADRSRRAEAFSEELRRVRENAGLPPLPEP